MRFFSERGIAGKLMATVGILVVLGELSLHFISWYVGTDYELNHFVVVVGAVIGFVGFWTVDPKQTRAGSLVLRDLIPRFGRRASDAVSIPKAETVIIAEPVPQPPEQQS
jgi:hypothetical protein